MPPSPLPGGRYRANDEEGIYERLQDKLGIPKDTLSLLGARAMSAKGLAYCGSPLVFRIHHCL